MQEKNMVDFEHQGVKWRGINCLCGKPAKHVGEKVGGGSVGSSYKSKLKEQQEIHKKDLIQPFREDKLSKEFVDEYPDQVNKMIDNKAITKKEANNAEEVWS